VLRKHFPVDVHLIITRASDVNLLVTNSAHKLVNLVIELGWNQTSVLIVDFFKVGFSLVLLLVTDQSVLLSNFLEVVSVFPLISRLASENLGEL
jgi:hypothetical protein